MKNWSPDRWLSVVAIIASLGTLFTIIYQTNLIRKQQYASVLPYLEMLNSWQGSSYRLVLTNNGVGPAFIENMRIIYGDSTFQSDPANFLNNVVKNDEISFSYSNLTKGRLIPPGENIYLLEGNDSISSIKLWSWFSGSDTTRVVNPEIEINYSSVYGETWQTKRYGSGQPIKLN